jgi:hypothetical protein
MNAIFSNINWLAVLVATVAYFALGAIWYSKAAFANKWIQGHNINVNDPNAKKGVGQIFLFSFVAMFVICLVLAILISKMGLTGGVLSGLKVGLITGVGISWMVICIGYLYTKKPMTLHIIDGLYHTVGQVIAAIILCIWTK